MKSLVVAIDRLTAVADDLGRSLASTAAGQTTPGIERAMLRLFDVTGVARDGRPVAYAVVERYASGDPSALAGGVSLPLAMAAIEYDLPAAQLAVDVADGIVDLRDETLLLAEPDNRAAAEAELGRLTEHAFQSSRANRLARRELTEVVGDAPWPWVGVGLHEPVADQAADEADDAVRAGADVLRVAVPAGRELADRLTEVGAEAPSWGAPAARAAEVDAAPAGSQRGLAKLRRRIDELSAERRRTVRLMTVAPPLALPESAVVAVLERVDIVSTDPLIDVVDAGLDADRALADAAFGYRLLDQAGCTILLGPGPLVVGPDLVAGTPADPTTRGGRALGLAVLSAAFARSAGMAPERLAIGGVPVWASEEEAAELAIIGLALRRACLPDIAIGFDEPPGVHPRWVAMMAAGLADAAPVSLIVREVGRAAVVPALNATRSAIGAADAASRAFDDRQLRPDAADQARTMVEAGIDVLERIAGEGWTAVVPALSADRQPLGAGTAVARAAVAHPLDPTGATS